MEQNNSKLNNILSTKAVEMQVLPTAQIIAEPAKEQVTVVTVNNGWTPQQKKKAINAGLALLAVGCLYMAMR